MKTPLDEQAEELAKILLKNNNRSYKQSFNVTNRDGRSTDEEIVVVAIYRNTKEAAEFQKLFEAFETKAVSYPSGKVCPLCNGTGRV